MKWPMFIASMVLAAFAITSLTVFWRALRKDPYIAPLVVYGGGVAFVLLLAAVVGIIESLFPGSIDRFLQWMRG